MTLTRLALLLPLLTACTANIESSTVYGGLPTNKSIAVSGYTTESGGWVYPQVLTSLNVSAKSSAATWQTIGAFVADTTPIVSGGENYYAWNGTLTNFTAATWPNGGVARVRVLFENDGNYDPGVTFDDLGCLIEDPGQSFLQIASACASHDSGYLHLVDKNPVSHPSADYISLRETPPVFFQNELTFPYADDYYAVVDPNDERTTLDDWQELNGFNGLGGALPGFTALGSAVYYNKIDLELGRDMHCVKQNGSAATACYVTNYGDPNVSPPGQPGPGDPQGPALAATIARNDDGLVATVAMEYRPNDALNRVTFFAFAPDGTRLGGVELDSEGVKGIPGACLSCHGGFYEGGTHSVTGAHFLPFDVDNFAYSTKVGYRLVDQQDDFRALNKVAVDTGPTPAITELVNGWYDNNLGTNGPDQDTDWMPAGWSSQDVVYREVVKPYCRGCHVALEDPALSATRNKPDFATFAEFDSYAYAIQQRVCAERDMPHAEVTRRRFFDSPARGHMIGELDLATACD
ncbi:MAG: hypothetical protein RIT81_22320 [Deltaproteobacteria bacterium]